MNKNKKIIIVIVSVIVLIGAGFFGYLYFKSPVKVSKSESISYANGLFIDNNYGYRFKTSADFILTSVENNSIKVRDESVSRNITISENNGGPWQVGLFIQKNIKMESLNDWLKEENSKSSGSLALEKSIKIDGVDALVTHYGVNGEQKDVVFIKDGVLYKLSMRGSDSKGFWNKSDYQEILESFKFIKGS